MQTKLSKPSGLFLALVIFFCLPALACAVFDLSGTDSSSQETDVAFGVNATINAKHLNEIAQATSTHTISFTPTSTATATFTPAPTTKAPSVLIRLRPGKDVKPILLEVIEGAYKLTSGTTATVGSVLGVYEDLMTFPPGLAIEVEGGKITLKGTTYPQGTKLFVNDSGKILRSGEVPASASPSITIAPITKPTPIPPLATKSTGRLNLRKVRVINNLNQPIKLTWSGPTHKSFTVYAHSYFEFEALPGDYSYTITAINFIPENGSLTIPSGTGVFTWTWGKENP